MTAAPTFRGLACDYDGTLATHDRIGPEALAALEAARRAGVRLILVTGRTFFELIRVCEPLDLFDAVVAENGGVLYFPRVGAIRDLGPAPPARLLAGLDRQGLAYQRGRVILGTWRSDEARVRAALAALGVRRDLVYNRAALMLLPPGVSKGTGVRQALRALGLSPHDVLAVGDAENDVEFFEACGFTACPGDAVDELRQRADWVLAGADGAAVARAIVGPILGGTLSLREAARRRLQVGWATESAEPLTIPARGVNVLIQGDPLSGKSWLAGVLIERLLERGYGLCVVDPEGDYQALGILHGVSVAEVCDQHGLGRALERFDYDPAACLVLDLWRLEHARRLALVETALRAIHERRRRAGPPHWVVVDEAHYLLHPEGVSETAAATLGDRGFCLITYRASWLRAAVIEAVDVCITARTRRRSELEFLRDRVGPARGGAVPLATVAPDLPQGEFLLLEADASGPRALTFVPVPRLTPHVRHLGKYVDGGLSPERGFLFREPDGRVRAAATSLGGFLDTLRRVPEETLRHHAARGDFSRWLLDVFADRELGRQLAKVERRWAQGDIVDLRRALLLVMASALGRDLPGSDDER